MNKNSNAFPFCWEVGGDGKTPVITATNNGLTKEEIFFKDILCALVNRGSWNDYDNAVTEALQITEIAFTRMK